MRIAMGTCSLILEPEFLKPFCMQGANRVKRSLSPTTHTRCGTPEVVVEERRTSRCRRVALEARTCAPRRHPPPSPPRRQSPTRRKETPRRGRPTRRGPGRNLEKSVVKVDPVREGEAGWTVWRKRWTLPAERFQNFCDFWAKERSGSARARGGEQPATAGAGKEHAAAQMAAPLAMFERTASSTPHSASSTALQDRKALTAADSRLQAALADGTIRLLSCDWLRSQQHAFVVPRHQEMPIDALLPTEAAAHSFGNADRSVAVLSYGWLTRSHPDPGRGRASRARSCVPALAGGLALQGDILGLWLRARAGRRRLHVGR